MYLTFNNGWHYTFLANICLEDNGIGCSISRWNFSTNYITKSDLCIDFDILENRFSINLTKNKLT